MDAPGQGRCHIVPHDIAVRRIQLQPPGPHTPGPGWEPHVFRAGPLAAVYTVTCRRRAPQWWHGTILITFLIPCAVLSTCTSNDLRQFGQQRLARLVYPYAADAFAAVTSDFELLTIRT